MRFVFLLLLLFITDFDRVSLAPTQVTFSTLTKANYLQAKRNCIVTKPPITFPIRKQNGRIIIQTAKGKKVFQDIVINEAAIKKGHGEEESTIYTYLGYLSDFHCHLINAGYYEIEEWLLITDSGQQLELWGEPLFSPDLHYIAASCAGIEYSGGQPNIIQLIALQEGNLRKVWSLEPKEWEPYQICWTSSNTLLLSRTMWTGKNPGTAYSYSKLFIN